MAVLELEPEGLVSEVADLEPEVVGLEFVELDEVAEHYNYKDSDTLDAVKVHTCLHQKLDDIHQGSRSEHCELHILAIDGCNNLD